MHNPADCDKPCRMCKSPPISTPRAAFVTRLGRASTASRSLQRRARAGLLRSIAQLHRRPRREPASWPGLEIAAIFNCRTTASSAGVVSRQTKAAGCPSSSSSLLASQRRRRSRSARSMPNVLRNKPSSSQLYMSRPPTRSPPRPGSHECHLLMRARMWPRRLAVVTGNRLLRGDVIFLARYFIYHHPL